MRAPFAMIASAALVLMVTPAALAATFEFEIGDVLVGDSNGQMGVYRGGVLVHTLSVPGGGYLLKPAFAANGDAYIPSWNLGQIHVFDRFGNALSSISVPGRPESLAFDSAGNLYVGMSAKIRMIPALGGLPTDFPYSGDYISLLGDCTLYFSADNPDVYRLDVCTTGATPTFFVAAGARAWNSEIVATPQGLLVGTDTDIRLFALDGTHVMTYTPGGTAGYYPVALDVHGTGFYTYALNAAGNSVYHVDVATGNSVVAFAHTQSSESHGLGVYGGSRGPIPPVPELAAVALTGLGLLAVAGVVLRRKA